ncbi:hypothetical protein [Streptomyces mirabilis]|uniref:hypothetical protein n=1 Tax=Streptomyces mirabilis TaxID=68239 RepID=UPI0033AC035F
MAIEIARTPASAARLRAAEYTAQSVDRGDAAWRDAMDELHAVHAWPTSRSLVSDRRWEYDPAEIVRAAEALHLDGTRAR